MAGGVQETGGITSSLVPSDIQRLLVLQQEILQDPQSLDLPPFRRDQLRLSAHGIELLRDHSRLTHASHPEGDIYEDRCFRKIVSQTTKSLLLGPCMTDNLLGQRFTAEETKPDVLAFDTSSTTGWRLTQLWEFRSTLGRDSVSQKLYGFSQLLEKLRNHPEYLPRLLSHAFRKIMRVPQQIEIPQNSKIPVVFVHPFRGGVRITQGPPFPLEFMRVRK